MGKAAANTSAAAKRAQRRMQVSPTGLASAADAALLQHQENQIEQHQLEQEEEAQFDESMALNAIEKGGIERYMLLLNSQSLRQKAQALGSLASAIGAEPWEVQSLIEIGIFDRVLELLHEEGMDAQVDGDDESVDGEDGSVAGSLDAKTVYDSISVRLAAAGLLRTATDPDSYDSVPCAGAASSPEAASASVAVEADAVAQLVVDHCVACGVCEAVAAVLPVHLQSLLSEPCGEETSQLCTQLFGLCWNLCELSAAAVERLTLNQALIPAAVPALTIANETVALNAAQFLNVITEENVLGCSQLTPFAGVLGGICTTEFSSAAATHVRALCIGTVVNGIATAVQASQADPSTYIIDLLPSITSVLRASNAVATSSVDARRAAAAREVALQTLANWSNLVVESNAASLTFLTVVNTCGLWSTIARCATNALRVVDGGASQSVALGALINLLSVAREHLQSEVSGVEDVYATLLSLCATALTEPEVVHRSLIALQDLLRLQSQPHPTVEGVVVCSIPIAASHLKLLFRLTMQGRDIPGALPGLTRSAACGVLAIVGQIEQICFADDLVELAQVLVSRLEEAVEPSLLCACEAVHAIIDALAEPHANRALAAAAGLNALRHAEGELRRRHDHFFIAYECDPRDAARCEEAIVNILPFLEYKGQQ